MSPSLLLANHDAEKARYLFRHHLFNVEAIMLLLLTFLKQVTNNLVMLYCSVTVLLSLPSYNESIRALCSEVRVQLTYVYLHESSVTHKILPISGEATTF